MIKHDIKIGKGDEIRIKNDTLKHTTINDKSIEELIIGIYEFDRQKEIESVLKNIKILSNYLDNGRETFLYKKIPIYETLVTLFNNNSIFRIITNICNSDFCLDAFKFMNSFFIFGSKQVRSFAYYLPDCFFPIVESFLSDDEDKYRECFPLLLEYVKINQLNYEYPLVPIVEKMTQAFSTQDTIKFFTNLLYNREINHVVYDLIFSFIRNLDPSHNNLWNVICLLGELIKIDQKYSVRILELALFKNIVDLLSKNNTIMLHTLKFINILVNCEEVSMRIPSYIEIFSFLDFVIRNSYVESHKDIILAILEFLSKTLLRYLDDLPKYSYIFEKFFVYLVNNCNIFTKSNRFNEINYCIIIVHQMLSLFPLLYEGHYESIFSFVVITAPFISLSCFSIYTINHYIDICFNVVSIMNQKGIRINANQIEKIQNELTLILYDITDQDLKTSTENLLKLINNESTLHFSKQ